jgi:hypothetical protein
MIGVEHPTRGASPPDGRGSRSFARLPLPHLVHPSSCPHSLRSFVPPHSIPSPLCTAPLPAPTLLHSAPLPFLLVLQAATCAQARCCASPPRLPSSLHAFTTVTQAHAIVPATPPGDEDDGVAPRWWPPPVDPWSTGLRAVDPWRGDVDPPLWWHSPP